MSYSIWYIFNRLSTRKQQQNIKFLLRKLMYTPKMVKEDTASWGRLLFLVPE